MPKKIARRITPEYLHNAALYYLQRYAAATGRLRDVLTRKVQRSCHDHPEQDLAALLPLVEAEIITLTRVELLNDLRLAGQLVDNWRARGMPARMIGIKLRQRGFDPQILNDLPADPGNEDGANGNELNAARRYLQRRRLGPFAEIAPDDRMAHAKNKQRAWAALARQGYDSDLIEQAMRKEQ